jgi:hypothetical protein
MDERKIMLKFREVDDKLDKLILRRDLFLWLSTLRKGGADNLIDQALERELRFYPEESNREVRYNPKLMLGLPYLIAGQPFPTLQNLTRLSSVPAVAAKMRAEAAEELRDIAERGSSPLTGGARSMLDTELATPQARLKSLLVTGRGDDKGGVMVNRTTFAKPTMLTISQLTLHAAVQQYEDLWIEILRPETAPAVPEPQGEKKAPVRLPFNANNFNVVRLKSIETSAVRWLKPIVLNSYSRGISARTAQETLFGTNLVRPFMPTFALRNFSATYCMLIDTKGRVRWLSSGEPTTQERDALPGLLHELEIEYHRSSK